MRELALSSPAADPAVSEQLPLRGCWFWAGWEPDRYYQRIGARKTAYFGNGSWIKDWRKNLESRGTLEKLAAAGATVLVTRFYKGFGPELEREDWASLRAFVQRAHDAGIAVWGYLQGQSLFGEFLFNERPEASGWIAQDEKGQPLLWAGAYNRYAPCLSSTDYREMMEDLVEEGLCSVGLDGIHLDNNYYRHCYCPRCKDLFRGWLNGRGDFEARTGIPTADFVEPPPLHAEAGMVPDPLAILWIEFGVRQRAEFLQALRARVRQCRPDAMLTGNPAFLRTYASRLTHSLDPRAEHSVSDAVCVENGNQPRFENGRLFTQADKHLFAQAAGMRTWVTSWRPGPHGASPPDSKAQLWAGLAEEFSFQGSYLGNNWALRPAGDGEKLLLDPLGALWKEFVEATSFFQGLERRLADEPRRQWGEVVVYVDTRTLSLFPGSDAPLVQAFLIGALTGQLPFRIVFQEQPIPEETHTILVVQQRALDAREFFRLAQAAREGEREIWMVGACGIYDEWCVPRSRRELERWGQTPSVRIVPLSAGEWLESKGGSSQYFKGETPLLREKGKSELGEILGNLARRQMLRLESPPGVLSNIEKFSGGGWIVHLRNLAPTEARGVRFFLRARSPENPRLLAYAPEAPDGRPLESRREGGTLEIIVPDFAHYIGVRITGGLE